MGVNIDLKNPNDFKKLNEIYEYERRVMIYLGNIFNADTFERRYPEEDFCLYNDFPFNQIVFIYDIMYETYDQNITKNVPTCTYLWLAQFYPVYKDYEQNYLDGPNYQELFKNLSNRCQFRSRTEFCNKSKFSISSSSYSDFDKEFQVSSDFIHTILIFASPLICLFGIFTNILVIITISKSIKKQKEFKEFRHYDYMRLNSCVHCIILVIQLVSVVNECTHEFWCSEINRFVIVQYYKIIFSEFLGTTFRFLANFTYLAFSMSRLSLIGKEYSKLVMYVAKDKSIKLYLAITIILSLVLSVCKYFRFMPAEISTSSSGIFTNFPDKLMIFALGKVRGVFQARLFLIFNTLCDLLNYLVFLVINLVLDIKMASELKKSLKEKEEKIEMTEKQKRKK